MPSSLYQNLPNPLPPLLRLTYQMHYQVCIVVIINIIVIITSEVLPVGT